MTTPIFQHTTSAGEWSPQLYSRTDIPKYKNATAYSRNWFVDVRGGSSTRPGTLFTGPSQEQNYRPRLIPFQFSISQAYELCFGNQTMTVIKNGQIVLNAGINVTNITTANPGVITATANGFINGQFVFLQNVGGMTGINGTWFKAANVTTNTLTLTDLFGNAISTIGLGTYTSGGTISSQYVLTTPYIYSDLPLLKYTQQNDVMTLTHTSYAPMYLDRLADNSWTITSITFAATQSPPTSVSASPSGSGSTSYIYVVTAINGTTGEESLPSAPGTGSSSATMSLVSTANVAVTWVAPSGTVPSQYKVYRTEEVPSGSPPAGSLYGFVGTTTGTGFTDVNIGPDFTNTPPQGLNPFTSNNNPGCATYFQQRQTFGGSTPDPETLWMSQPGNYNNFDQHLPTVASDAITASIVSNQLNPIEHLVPLNSLIAMSSSGAWQISGNGTPGVGITPSNITAQPQAYNGCATNPAPIPINYDILYVQAKGSIVRDLQYNFYVNLYTGTDMTVFSKHLFFGHQIQEWAYAEEPFKTVWSVREDGALLSFAYLKEQDIYGWAHHDTGQYLVTIPNPTTPTQTPGLSYPATIQATAGSDNFLSVSSIPETSGSTFADAVYFIVQRNINGNTLNCIERMDNRNFGGDVRKAWFVDAGLQYGLTYPNATLTISPIVTNGSISGYTLKASGAVFNSGMVGNTVRANNGVFIVTAYNNTMQITVSAIRQPVYDLEASPNAPPLLNLTSVASGNWTCTTPVSKIYGLNHLEGMYVTGVADGNVIPLTQVIHGMITLSVAATDIIIGLPFYSQLQSLYLDSGEPTTQGKRKKVDSVTIRMANTRGLSIGPDFNTLVPIKERSNQNYGNPIELFTGDEGPIKMSQAWTKVGQVCMAQMNPLPATVGGWIPFVELGEQ